MTGNCFDVLLFTSWPNPNVRRVATGKGLQTALAWRDRTLRMWPSRAGRLRPVTWFVKGQTHGHHRRQNTPLWRSPAACLFRPPLQNTWRGDARVSRLQSGPSPTGRQLGVPREGLGVSLMYLECDLSATFVFAPAAFSARLGISSGREEKP